MKLYYKLIGHDPVPCSDVDEWVEWATKNEKKRHVARTKLTSDAGDKVTISTVFLMIDHNFGSGEPILFESMVFGGLMNERQWRYCTWEEAEQGHAQIVRLVRDAEVVKVGSGEAHTLAKQVIARSKSKAR